VFAVDLGEPNPLSSPDGSPDAEENEAEKPVKVDVVSLPPSPLQELAGWFGPLVSPLGSLTMVIILTVFMLAEREDFRNRMVRLLASSNLAIATTAITEATYRTALWLRMMCLINAIYAAVIGAGLYLLGLPSPFVWAVAAFVFRFIPYIGGWMCALVPVLLSFAVFEDWLRPFAVIGLYVLMDFVVNSILEPWLYGRPIGLTSVGVILAVMFWAWMWGLVGLLLAVPITLWLVVLGRYVPQLNAFTTLLGDSSDLPSYHTLYQRLLAFDSDEALTIWDQLVEDADKRAEAFDQVLLPLMQRAAADHRAGFISDTQLDFIAHTIGEGLNELTARESPEPPADGADSAEPRSKLGIFVQPLHSRLDHLAARYLALELARQDAGNVAIGGPDLLSNDLVQRIGEDDIDIFIISGLRPLPNRKGALLVKKLQAQFPDLSILRAFWDVRPAATAKNGVQEVVTVEQMSDALGAVTNRKQRSQSNGSVSAAPSAVG
jgi:hypothetical protein